MVAVDVWFSKPGLGSFQAITCQVIGAGWSRGATEDRGPLTVYETSQATVYLVDPGRDLDPANTGGVFYPDFDVGADFKILLENAPAFLGRIDAISHSLTPPLPGYEGVPIARITAIDWAARLARVNQGGPWSAEPPQTRFLHLMQAAGYTGSVGTSGAFATSIQAGSVVNDCWSDTVVLVQNELGAITIRPTPAVTFIARPTVWATGVTPQLHIGCDDPDSVQELALDSLDLLTQMNTVRNQVLAGRAGGSLRPAVSDSASITKYGLRTMTRNDLIVTTDAMVDAWAALIVAQQKVPARSIPSAVVRANSAAVSRIEATDLFVGRVHVYQEHHGDAINVVKRLLGVQWSIDDQANAVCTLVLGQDTR